MDFDKVKGQVGIAVQVLQLVSLLVGLLVSFVSAAEVAYPQSGAGAQKLALVKGWLKAAADATGTLSQVFDAAWPTLEAMVNSLVAGYNALKGKTAPAAAAAQGGK